VLFRSGNTNFHDDVRRSTALASKGITYIDAGTSGGIWGLTEGYCLMVGGDEAACTRLEPIFLTLAPPNGYQRVGGPGAGHYVKMVHNGIEYGLMQAYAEGFELLQKSDYKIDVAKVSALWMQGSVVRSWLLELAARALADDPSLSALKGYVEDSGEGRWTLQEGLDKAIPMPVLTAAIFTRFRSREDNPFGERMLPPSASSLAATRSSRRRVGSEDPTPRTFGRLPPRTFGRPAPRTQETTCSTRSLRTTQRS